MSIRVRLESGELSLEVFVQLLESYLRLLEDTKTAGPFEVMPLLYIPYDLAGHKEKTEWSSYGYIARQRGFASDDEGNFTPEAKIFAKGVLELHGMTPFVRDPSKFILNWEEVKSAFEALVNQPTYVIPKDVENAILVYWSGNPGALKVLDYLAITKRWTIAKDVEDFLGYPMSEVSKQRASEIWTKYQNLITSRT